MWRREQYEQAALDIAKNYVGNSGETSLTDLATKVAQDNGLNPEGVRTLVRLTNVSAFQELFPKKAGEDKNIEFDLGDPEAVLAKLHSGVRDKLASVEHEGAHRTFFNDFYGPMDSDEEKVAAAPEVEEVVEASMPPKIAAHTLTRVRNTLEEQREEHTQNWLVEMEKGAQAYRALYGSPTPQEKLAFQNDVVALVGTGAAPELQLLTYLVEGKTAQVCDGADIEKVAEYHVCLPTSRLEKVIPFIKEARHSRVKAEECAAGVKQVDQALRVTSNG